jgi:hypothetical protein
MCKCDLCQDSRRFQAELEKLPSEQQPVFQVLYDILLDNAMDLEHARAVLDGSWPSAQETLEFFRQKPGVFINAATEPGAEMLEHLSQLPVEAQPYFWELVQRLTNTGVERARLKNVIHHAVPDAALQIEQYRKSLVTVRGQIRDGKHD